MKNYFSKIKSLSLSALWLLLVPTLALAQTATPLAAVQKQLANFDNQTLQENIFVHADRPLYLVGETMWFKVYCVDARSHRPLDVSKIAYLDVLDQQGNPVAQIKIALAGGRGEGSLLVPTTLVNGTYTLRAYTNWMKNFSPKLFFETPVTILNPFLMPETSGTAVAREKPFDLQFFPEGGHLVAGLGSRVAFRALGTDGRGTDFQGAIVGPQGDTLIRFQPQRLGIGSFVFTPEDRCKLPGRRPRFVGPGDRVHISLYPKRRLRGAGTGRRAAGAGSRAGASPTMPPRCRCCCTSRKAAPAPRYCL